MMVITLCMTSGLAGSGEIRSFTTVSLSSWRGMPENSTVRGPLEVARLDLEGIVAAVIVGIEPLADRVAHEARFLVGREIASVGVDAARHERFEIHVGDVRQDHEFE